MLPLVQLAIFGAVTAGFICGVIWKLRRDEKKLKKTADQDEVYNLLSNTGSLLLSEIALETDKSEEQVKAVLDQLLAKGFVCQRPVPGCKYVSEATIPWALDLRRRRAG